MATHASILAWRIPVDRGAGRATVHGVVKSRTQMSDTAHTWAVNTFLILTPYQSYHLHRFLFFFSFSDCLFILLMVSFAVQKLLSLIRSHLLIFDFVSISPGDRPKKIWLWLRSKGIQPMFSSRSFMVSSLTFEFIFVYGLRKCSSFTYSCLSAFFSFNFVSFSA